MIGEVCVCGTLRCILRDSLGFVERYVVIGNWGQLLIPGVIFLSDGLSLNLF